MTQIAMPMRFEAGRLVTAAEGTPEELQARIVTTLRCSPGDRLARPTFGTELEQLEFEPSTTDVVGVALTQVQDWVPDAEREDVVAALQVVGA